MATRTTTRCVKKHTRQQYKPRRRKRWSGKHRAKGPARVTICNGRIVMLLPRRLKSLNKRGGWRSQQSDREAWAKLLATAEIVDDGSMTLPAMDRMRVEIVRLAPSRRYMLDEENKHSASKRLTDSLVEAGYLIDDKAEWCDGPYISQGVSTDKKYWTAVTIYMADPFSEAVFPVISPEDYLVGRDGTATRSIPRAAAPAR